MPIHQFSKFLVEKYNLIAMETLNIKGMFQNKKMVHQIAKNSIIQTNTND